MAETAPTPNVIVQEFQWVKKYKENIEENRKIADECRANILEAAKLAAEEAAAAAQQLHLNCEEKDRERMNQHLIEFENAARNTINQLRSKVTQLEGDKQNDNDTNNEGQANMKVVIENYERTIEDFKNAAHQSCVYAQTANEIAEMSAEKAKESMELAQQAASAARQSCKELNQWSNLEDKKWVAKTDPVPARGQAILDRINNEPDEPVTVTPLTTDKTNVTALERAKLANAKQGSKKNTESNPYDLAQPMTPWPTNG